MNIKALFAVNENGNVFPLVISNAQKNEGRYSYTIKIGDKTLVNEYEEDEFELWNDAQEDSDIFPSDESMALYLKNVPSQGLGELFETSNFDDTAIGFIIIEFSKGLLYSSTQDEYVRETVIFKEKNPFILMPSGHLFLWVDKFHMCEGILQWLQYTDLNLVDMVVWNKGKIGMGFRTRRKSEYLIVCQKSPVRAKGKWTIHNIPDVWEEKTIKIHPHSKPLELQKALIEATTQEGDWILDPAAGGYSVLTACQELNRNFIGCDIEFGDESYGTKNSQIDKSA